MHTLKKDLLKFLSSDMAGWATKTAYNL